MRYSIKDNKASFKRIMASILDNTVIRKESAYVDYDQDVLIIKSVLEFKNYMIENTTCNAMSPKIRLVTEINLHCAVLDIDGVTVDDSVEATLSLANDKRTVSVDSIKTSVITDMQEEGFIFSKEYSKLIGMVKHRNKRINGVIDKVCRRKLDWSIDYEVSSKLYTSTIKAKATCKSDYDVEAYYMHLEDSTHVCTHTSAKSIIDELLAIPYKFHGTTINYSARDYTKESGHFIVGNIISENEANKIILDTHNKTRNIARYLI